MKFLYKLVKVAFVFMIVMTIFFVGLYLYAVSLPKININNVNNISIYDKENDIIFSGNGNKEWISLNNISNYLIDATISTEDKRFYNHPGFDILRIAKSMYVNVTTKNLSQGASTITQQLARNLFSNFDKTWRRKLKEAWYAFRIEIDYSKYEILEAYLNTINYGNGVLGIENASYYYFNKSAKNLSLAEASMLAGIPKAPNAYSPLNDSETAKKRQGIILNYMVKNKKISEKEAEDAYDIELKYIGKKQKFNLSTLMYYKDAVVNELNSIKSIPDSYINSGLKVYTSLDINAQTILENSMKNNITDDKLQVASIMMRPDNGAIIALIGGTDYLKTEYNRALYSKRQVGSTMKPILYYAALENGFTASTNFLSQATTFTFSDNYTYTPQNYGAIYPNHDISMAAAIAYSDNIYAVKTHLFLGEEVLVNTAKRIGINETLEKIPSLPLGTEELNIIDYVGGYATFANGGYKIKPHLIEKVLDCNDNVLYEFKEEKEPVLNSSIVYILNDLMTGTYDLTMIDYNYPTCGSLVNKITNKYAIKTGTTDTDSWTIGYNKDILIGVWNGYDDAKTIEINAVKSSKNIWSDAIEGYLKDKDTSWYDMPDNVVGVLVDPINGTLADNKTKKKKILYYIKGTEPIN